MAVGAFFEVFVDMSTGRYRIFAPFGFPIQYVLERFRSWNLTNVLLYDLQRGARETFNPIISAGVVEIYTGFECRLSCFFVTYIRFH